MSRSRCDARARCVLAAALQAAVMLVSAGCLCRQGYHVHGDWSLTMNRLPCQCAGCCQGACGDQADGCDSSGSGGQPAAIEEPLPAPPPRFHPVPTTPVHRADGGPAVNHPIHDARQLPAPSVELPLDAAAEPLPAESLPPRVNDPVSVLKRPGTPVESSWVFGGRQRSPAAVDPQLEHRRQLAESWKGTTQRR